MNRDNIEEAADAAKRHFEDMIEDCKLGPVLRPLDAGGPQPIIISRDCAPRPTHVMVDHQTFRSILANRHVYLEYVTQLADGNYTLRGSAVVFVYGRDVFKFFYMEA